MQNGQQCSISSAEGDYDSPLTMILRKFGAELRLA